MEKSISTEQEIQILLAEYRSLRDEQHMYIKEYSPRLTVFGTAVLGIFGYAINQGLYQQLMFSLIPAVILLIGAITVAQSHLVAAAGARVRNIELRLREINHGKPILEWEHRYAPAFVFPVMLRIRLGAGVKCKTTLNPVFLGSFVTFAGGTGVAVLSAYKAISGFAWPWNVGYGLCFVLGFGVVTLQAWGFFSTGPRLHLAQFDRQPPPR